MASSIVTSAAQKLGGLLVEEAKYLYAVSDKMKSLQIELEWMECFLEDADNREHQEKIVRKWISEIRDIAYEAEDIIERFLHEITYHRENGIWNTIKWFSCCAGDALTLHFVGSSIDELRARISELIPRMQMYGIRSNGRLEGSKNIIAMREQRRTYSHTEQNPVGLDEHEKVLVEQLLTNKEANVIGISGMGGLGKTTLARKVFSNIAIQEHFQNNCAWVFISKEFDRRNIFEEILIGLSTDGEESKRKKVRELGDEELPRKICEVLKEMECLVVVDDIWYEHSWDKLKPAFESIKSSSSKILITTRNERLVKHADVVGYSHRADLLGEEDSWKLLQQKAFSQGNNTVAIEVKTEMEKLGKEMVKHCKGLPLAIVALGGILAERRKVDEWKIVQENISSYLIWETGEGSGNDSVSPVLELSYYDLPFYLKPCFLFMGCFPEDFEIRAQSLYHLWEAEGLVTERDGRQKMKGVPLDDIAESHLNELVQRCMVQAVKRWPDGRIKSCRLHDIMRDMCLQKCIDVDFLSTVNYGNSDVALKNGTTNLLHGCPKLRHCAIYLADQYDDESSSANSHTDEVVIPEIKRKEGATIRSLLVFPCGSQPYDVSKLFSQGMDFFSLLWVLDLQGSLIENLPAGIKNCIHLRYLSLRDTKVNQLPQCILTLKYLETLDIRCRRYNQLLVHWDFQKLERLKHLYLPTIIALKSNSEKLKFTIEQLHQMETFKNFGFKACRVEDIRRMSKLRIFTVSPQNIFTSRGHLEALLKSPMVTSGCLLNTWKTITMASNIINERPTILWDMNNYLRGLKVIGTIDDGDVQIFPHNLTRLTLEETDIGEERVLELEKLPHLEKLNLEMDAVKGNKMSFSEGGFPKLVSLDLVCLMELEEWEVEEGALPNLRYLNVWHCEKLKKAPKGLSNSVEIDCIESFYDDQTSRSDSDEDIDDTGSNLNV